MRNFISFSLSGLSSFGEAIGLELDISTLGLLTRWVKSKKAARSHYALA